MIVDKQYSSKNDRKVFISSKGNLIIQYIYPPTKIKILHEIIQNTDRYKKEADTLHRIYKKYDDTPVILIAENNNSEVLSEVLKKNFPEKIKYIIYQSGKKYDSNKIKGGCNSCAEYKMKGSGYETEEENLLGGVFNDEEEETNIFGGAIPEDLTNEEIINLIKEYGPITHLHPDANYYPDSIENITQYYNKEIRNGEVYLTLKQRLKDPQDRPLYFRGNPVLSDVPTYVILRNHKDGFILEFLILFHYNIGKSVFNTTFGSHVFDLTRCYIVFNKKREPVFTGNQYHSHKLIWKWKNDEEMSQAYNRKGLKQQYIGNHPLFFHAIRGNELVPFDAPRYTYVNKKLLKLRDYFGFGPKLDTYNKFVLIKPENYYNISNIAVNQDNKEISLELPNLGIKNWTAEISHIGHDRMGKVKIGDMKAQFRLTAHINFKLNEFRTWDKGDIELQNYLNLQKNKIEEQKGQEQDIIPLEKADETGISL